MSFHGAMKLSDKDNVATCLESVSKGENVDVYHGDEVSKITAIEPIPFGFKIALTNIACGQAVQKYGESIGLASTDIDAGAMVHVHNLEGARGRGDLVQRDAT